MSDTPATTEPTAATVATPAAATTTTTTTTEDVKPVATTTETTTVATEKATTTEATPSATATATATATDATATTTDAKPVDTKKEEKKEEKKVVHMYGVCHSSYGSPRDVLQTSHELIKPSIHTSKQVLIRVHAAGINPVDYKFLDGNMANLVKRKFPYTPGLDVAGVVEAVGTGCKRIKVGDEVYADLGKDGGAMAEYCVADESIVALKPKNLTFAEAASVGVAGLTSYQALLKHGSLRKDDGKHILILNGAGGTGSYGIQIGKAYGAHVTVTCSTRNAAFCSHLGADRIIDYTKHEWSKVIKPHSIDIVYDCVGTPNSWQQAKLVLKKGGIFITITGDTPGGKASVGSILGTAATIAGRKLASLVTKHRYHWFLTSSSAVDLAALTTMFEAKTIRPIMEKYYSIESKGKADEKDSVIDFFEHMKGGRTRGKLVLEIYQPGERHVFDFDQLPEYVEPEPEVKEEEVKQETKTETTDTKTATTETTTSTGTTTTPADATATPVPETKPAEAATATATATATPTPAAADAKPEEAKPAEAAVATQ